MAMEDWNLLVADCAVFSCCCQCLILQIIIFFLLNLPCKLIRKAKEYCKKLRHRRKRGMIIRTEKRGFQDDFWEFQDGSELSFQVERFPMNGDSGFWCCIEEVEKVLEEFSQKGEFAFGSFWGRDRPTSPSTSVAHQQEFASNVAQFEFVEVVASLSCSLHG